jgi:hypothetical protein
MHIMVLDSVLRKLWLVTKKNKSAKEQPLRVFIGLRKNPA